MPDTLIIGAGPAGSALAYFLAERGRDVLLVDKSDFPRDKTCGDGLSPRALHVLRRLGLLERALAVGFRINRVLFFAPNGNAVETPIGAFGNLPDYSLVLPRYQLDDLIRQRAVEAGVEFRARITVTDVLREGGQVVGVRANTPDGPQEIRAPLTVLAIGASTGLLERAQLLSAPPAYGRAARAYFTNVRGLSDAVEFHFDSVPLPGYGWVFPTGPTSANVGAGYLARSARHNSPAQVYEAFIANPRTAHQLSHAQAASPVKGFPLRFDFPAARLAVPGLLMIGEACGLVNPLTGEGIDYALESAETAAEVLGDLSSAASLPQTYTRALRARFQRAFVNIARVRDLYLRPFLLNRFTAAANRHADLARLLLDVALGHLDPAAALSLKTLWRVLRG